MKLNLLSDNLEVTDNLKSFIQKKFITKLEKHMKNLYEDEKKAYMRISDESRWGFITNFEMWLPGKKHIYAEEKDDNLETAIVRLRKEVERQIKDYMGRVRSKYNFNKLT